MNTIEHNTWSWSYFNGFKNPEIAKRLCYYRWEPYRKRLSILEKVPLEKRPANFELFFGRVPADWYSGPIRPEEYENGIIKVFYNIADAVKACNEYFEDAPLYFFSFPGLDYISKIGNQAGNMRVMEHHTHLFPTCVAPICEIASHLNIVEDVRYTASPND